MKEFDLRHTPLRGVNLVEASAGTGKTYTIEGIFIRLILEEKIPADQILVVTFTKAATDELKERIHTKLLETRNAIVTGKSEDNLIKFLLNSQYDAATAEQLVCDALIDFDKAAIFTIHGFCQRILYENAFETGTLFDTELIPDQSYLIQEICDDFWRKHFYDASPEFVSYAVSSMGGPHYFYRLLSNTKLSGINIIPDISDSPSLTALPGFRAIFLDLVDSWVNVRTIVLNQLKSPALNGTIYGSLKNNPDPGGRTKRDVKISTLADAMDRMLSSAHSTLPLFPEFEKFTTAKLQKSTRKNQSTPVHPFFDLCQDFFAAAIALAAQIDTVIVYLKSALIKYVEAELPKRKQEKNIQYFDDLLLLVRKALAEKKGGALVEAVRQKYRVALVDEFQDTDNIQYEIFSKLFGTEKSILFMIGDPKQAIYGFRGADIFSYLKASRTSKSQYTLTRNWRSTPAMITAVNTIFSRLPEPFVFKEIGFESAKPSLQECQSASGDTVPFTIWYLDSRKFDNSGKRVNKSDAENMTSAAVAEEIIRLSASEGQPLDLGDIAVLVRTNRQARLVQNDLALKNIPAVLHSTGNIFDTHEALQIQIILMSIAEPSNVVRLKTAMAMEIMPETAEALLHTDPDSTWMESRLEQMAQYHLIWDKSGFMRMFRQFLANEGIKERLLGFHGGERRLTNILHLAEILHHACIQQNLGMSGVIKWLAEQRNPATLRLEEHQLRLESDDRAVKIVTVHKSKGLEYKIVFCPFSWDNADIRNEEFRFHDIENDWQPTLHLGGVPQDKHLGWAQTELLAENLRLLYVALTRCREKCYLAWGRINRTESSALSYLLHRQIGQGGLVADQGYDAVVANLKDQIAAKTDDDFLADLELIGSQSLGSIQVQPLPQRVAESRFFSTRSPKAILSCRHFNGKINRQWRLSSYSTLASTRSTDTDSPDRDILQNHPLLPFEMIEPTPVTTEQKGAEDIFAFPKGTRAGLFFHDVLENIDFSARSFDDDREIVAAKLQAYEFEPKWVDVVCRMLREVASLSLTPDEPELTLQSISPSDRINELEFYFPLKTLTPGILQEIFKSRHIAEKFKNFPENLGKLTFSPSSGFVKGFIDMIFRFKGRFYLVDWKSNYLGPTIENYRRRHLDQNMMEHYYVLQYHLYTLALYRYLQKRHPDFNYKNHFGGVFYLFLRGVDHNRGSDYGLFFDRPDPQLVNALDRALIPEI